MAKTVTELVSAFEPQMSPEAQELITNWTKDVISRTALQIALSIPDITTGQLECIRKVAARIEKQIE